MTGLTKEGFNPPSSDALGIKDLGVSNPYNIPILEEALGNFGYRLQFYPEIPTTMTVIETAALSNEAPMLVALADHQTNGVGRDETRQWHDTLGKSILVSILLNSDDRAASELADIIAIRTCQAIRKTGVNALIKAPNDIVDADTGKKISGILVQNVFDNKGRYKGTMVGIGVNVGYTQDELETYPTEYGATSVNALTGKANSRQQILIDILKGVSTAGEEAFAMAVNGNTSVRDEQNKLWQGYSYLLGKNVAIFEGDEKIVEGSVVETKVGNGIVIETENGQRHTQSIFDTDTKVRVVS